jgi:outer membrane protein assembly factor BamB
MTRLGVLPVLVLAILAPHAVRAQRWVNPNFDTHRLDYRDLGYPTQNLIPADNSRITALLSHSNGLVYGATSGRTQAYLFFYNRYINKVRPLGRIAEEKGVFHALMEGKDGRIYIGTGLNQLAQIRLTQDFPVSVNGTELQLWKDIRRHYESYPGGHIYEYDPKTGDARTYRNEDACPLKDLGIPVPGNSVYAMTLSPDRNTIYGISYPDAHFFVFDLSTGKSRDLGEFLTYKVYSGPERDWRSVPRALYCDPRTGDVYTSGDNGFIVRYSLETGRLALTYMRLPGEYWEGLNSRVYPVVESFEADARGNVYAATNDGYLVRLDLAREETTVIGKPRIMRRTRAMKIGLDGKIYMITGEPERTCKLHMYDPATGGFSELGPFAVDRSPYYSRRAYQFDAMAIGADGTVFCGESDRGGKLFLYMPGTGVFKGLLNPANAPIERMRPDTPGLIPEKL